MIGVARRAEVVYEDGDSRGAQEVASPPVISWTAKQSLSGVGTLILKMVVRLFVCGYIELQHKPSFLLGWDGWD